MARKFSIAQREGEGHLEANERGRRAIEQLEGIVSPFDDDSDLFESELIKEMEANEHFDEVAGVEKFVTAKREQFAEIRAEVSNADVKSFAELNFRGKSNVQPIEELSGW